ncbi:MAG: hypothetical protein K5793_05455 [Nitrosarchaeum sp.]|nr:hypothetical protein [Nitrosarchaeum sp.]
MSFGAGFLIFAGTNQLHPESDIYSEQNQDCNIGIRLCNVIESTQTFQYSDGLKREINSTILFTTFDVWAVNNPINYTIMTTVNPPDSIDKFYFLILQPNENVTKIDGSNVVEYVNRYKHLGSLFEFDKIDSTHFTSKGIWRTQLQHDVVLYGLMFKDNQVTATSEIPLGLSIESHLGKIQAETNRAVLKQVQETRITNDRIVGLSIILISLVPIGMIVEKFINKRPS